MRVFLPLLSALLLTPPAGTAGETSASVAKKLQSAYASLKSVEADFEQVYRPHRFPETKASGHVWFQRGGKMRWDYDSPKGKVLASDGKAITLYDPEDNQALVTPFEAGAALPPPLSLLWGKERLEDEFTMKLLPETGGKNGEIRLECTPKKPIPNVARIVLGVRPGSPMWVTTTLWTDLLGGENEIKFRNLKTNVPVMAQRFTFEPPKGVVRVDREIKEN